MKNSLGNSARGDGFYLRPREIRKIYRAISTNGNIYLSAPRRVGKTSILKHLEESPEEGLYFVYTITESVDSNNDFFKVIFEELIKSKAINKLSKVSNSLKSFLSDILQKVKSFQGVELREGEEPNYYDLLLRLIENMENKYGRVVIMIDEFPQTIQNILDAKGLDEARNFIQLNRELRHQKELEDKVSFIYTGSISLFPMIEKITSLTAVNDLKTIEVEPLTAAEAKDFLAQLMSNENIEITDDSLNYVLEKIKWFTPFHLQLIQQEIVDVYESKGEITNSTIDTAFLQIIHVRNKPQFVPYFSRLNSIFKGNEYNFVMDVLMFTAKYDSIDGNDIYNLGVKNGNVDTKACMGILDSDGYLFVTKKVYRYTSPILQMWCKKHICNED
jgi:uncharacterized protein